MCFTLRNIVRDVIQGLRDLQTASSSSLTKILIVQSPSPLTQTECTSIVSHFWLLNSHKAPWKIHYDTPYEEDVLGNMLVCFLAESLMRR